jgi:phosphoglycerate dehydrogenase-like enzyme
MSGKKVLYSDEAPKGYREVLERRKPEGFAVCYWKEMNKQQQQVALREADYFLVGGEQIGEELLLQAKKVRFIQRTGVGVNNIDIETATRLHIPVSIIPTGNSVAVAELAILFPLALYRNLMIANNAIKAGRWLNSELRPISYELEGKTHGFVGFGNIGRETAKRSKVFGTNIIYYDVCRAPLQREQDVGAVHLPLEEVLKRSDILSIHVPLTQETRGLIGMKELALMKSTALLINVARGGIVVESDLYLALKGGIIAGAGIDTWESEPINPDNPLLTLDNVIATPHCAAGTIDTFNKCVHLSFENIQKAEKDNRPQFVVNNIDSARSITSV